MEKIIQILRETETKKITGDFIRFKYFDDDGMELEKRECAGKCAMGVLACESNNEDLNLEKNSGITSAQIMKEYGINDESMCPHLIDPKDSGEITWNYTGIMPLNAIIIRLNDLYELSFKDIADFLEVTFGEDLK